LDYPLAQSLWKGGEGGGSTSSPRTGKFRSPWASRRAPGPVVRQAHHERYRKRWSSEGSTHGRPVAATSPARRLRADRHDI